MRDLRLGTLQAVHLEFEAKQCIRLRLLRLAIRIDLELRGSVPGLPGPASMDAPKLAAQWRRDVHPRSWLWCLALASKTACVAGTKP